MKYAICGLIGAYIGVVGAFMLIGTQFERHCVRGSDWKAGGIVYHCSRTPR